MVDWVKFSITGASEVNKVIQQLPKELAQNVYLQSLRQAANTLRTSLQKAAPYGQQSHKKYAKDVKTKFGSFTKLAHIRDMIKTTVVTKTDISFQIDVHSGKAFWGAFYEFGTSKQAPHPFFRPTFDRDKEQLVGIIGVEMGKKIESTAIRLAGPLNKSGLL